jgi:hypothetical protein
MQVSVSRTDRRSELFAPPVRKDVVERSMRQSGGIMEHSGRRWIRGGMAALGFALAAGCVDSGLPDRNLPLEEAEHRPFRYQVYDVRPEAEAIVHHDDSDWAVAGAAERIPASALVPAGAGGSQALFSLASDAAPFDRLYMESEGGWIPLARIH